MTRTQREDLEKRLEQSTTGASRLFADHSREQLLHQPGGSSWSAAECVVHLSLTSAATVPRIEATVVELRRADLRSATPCRMGLMGSLLRWSLEPGRFRMRTTAAFTPVRIDSFDDVLPEFLRRQARLTDLIRSAEGFDLSARTIISPFNSRVKYTAFAALQILETHERRHLRQAEQAVSESAA